MHKGLPRRRLLAAAPVLVAGLVTGFPMIIRRARADAGAVNVYSARHYPSDEILFAELDARPSVHDSLKEVEALEDSLTR